ncbi:MAG: response regulator [Thermoanaerobaculia bacterium]
MERFLSSRTLLLVEDNVSLAACATEFLARRGLDVDAAFDLASALQRLPTRSWDAVVTDLDLTGRRSTDGLEVVAAAACSEPRPAILVWTGSATAEVRSAAFHLGADDVVEKGNLSVLCRRLASCLVARDSREPGRPDLPG